MASKQGKKIKSPSNLVVDNKSGRKSARFRDSKSSNKVIVSFNTDKRTVSGNTRLILSVLR